MSTVALTRTIPPRPLVLGRWFAFASALVLGVLVSVLNHDLIREKAVQEGVVDPAELDLTITFATWFGAMANLLTVVGVTVVVALLAGLLLRTVESGRRSVIRHSVQLLASVVLVGVFVAGLLR